MVTGTVAVYVKRMRGVATHTYELAKSWRGASQHTLEQYPTWTFKRNTLVYRIGRDLTFKHSSGYASGSNVQ